MATLSSSNFLRFFLLGSIYFLCFLCSLKGGFAFERRETTQSHNLHHTYHIAQISSLIPATSCKRFVKGIQNKRESLEVVHKNGPCSQLHLGKANAPNHTQVLVQDQSRVDSIHSRLSKSTQDNLRDSEATIPAKSGSTLGSANYIVTVGLGTPPEQLSLIFDTGSDLTWTQCKPCARSCYSQKEPIFNPSLSKTYSNISCNSNLCNLLTSATGNTPGCSTSTCVYGIQYGDSSFSVGFFGQETLRLTPTDTFDNFLFGCGQNNKGLFEGTAGLFGLGRDRLSFVSQSEQKYGKFFSYCLPSSPSSTGYLSFGKGSGVSSKVKFTTLSTYPQAATFYFIDMMGISVGGRKLSIPTSLFSTAGTLIDSGTVITRLPPTAYASLRTAFRQLMSNYPMGQSLSILDTCYDLSNYNSVSVPKISFFFGGGVEVPMHPSGILYAASQSQVCLAVAPNSDDTDVAIFGNTQQLTLDVVYDVAGGRLGFGPGGCQ